MKEVNCIENKQELGKLCTDVRAYIQKKEYQKCEDEICHAMCQFPHAPEPHNLIGILLEKQGKHLQAMKHFRASWELDPTYAPARWNLMLYGTFFRGENVCAYEEKDCVEEAPAKENRKGIQEK